MITLYEKIREMNQEQFAKWMASGNASCLSCGFRLTHENKIGCSDFSRCKDGYMLMLSTDIEDIKITKDTMDVLDFFNYGENH